MCMLKKIKNEQYDIKQALDEIKLNYSKNFCDTLVKLLLENPNDRPSLDNVFL